MKKKARANLLVAIMAALLQSACTSAQPTRQANPVAAKQSLGASQANVAIVKRFLDEVVNGGHLELVDQLWAADLRWHGGSLGEVHGIDDYKAGLRAAVGGTFSSMRLDIKDIVAAEDKVVVRFVNSGENTGSFMGLPPVNKRVAWEGIGIYRIKDGKIAEAWFTEDIWAPLLNLGSPSTNR